MARYIDADRFIEWLEVGHLRSPSEKCLSENDVKAMIELQPTVDLEEKCIVSKDIYKKMTEHDNLMRLIYDYFTTQIEYGDGINSISKKDIEKYITSMILDL